MANRAAKFVSAIFASILAGGHLAAVSDTAAHAAVPAEEKCLSGPKGAPPAGGHWYYRTDRTTKRSCWYVGDAKQKAARATPQDSSASASPASPPDKAAAQPSVADARAELPMPQSGVETDIGIAAARPIAAPLANDAGMESSQRVNVLGSYTQQSAFIFASRWPEASGVRSSANPAPADGEPVASQQPAPAAAPPPPQAIAPIKFAAADASSEKPTGSIQMLLVVIVGALFIAGLMAGAVVKFGNARAAGRRDGKADRREIWDPLPSDPSRSMPYPLPSAHLPRGDFPPEQRKTHNPNDKVTDMLARLARSART